MPVAMAHARQHEHLELVLFRRLLKYPQLWPLTPAVVFRLFLTDLPPSSHAPPSRWHMPVPQMRKAVVMTQLVLLVQRLMTMKKLK